jgi:hypothetical protein
VFGRGGHQLEDYETNVPTLLGRQNEWFFDEDQADPIVEQTRATERAAQIAQVARDLQSTHWHLAMHASVFVKTIGSSANANLASSLVARRSSRCDTEAVHCICGVISQQERDLAGAEYPLIVCASE